MRSRSQEERGNSTLRFLDKYVGIPLVLLLGIFRRKRSHFNAAALHNAAFLHTAAIGDTVLLSAVVNDFKTAFPAARLTLFTGSSNYQTAKLIAGIDRVIKLPVSNPLLSIKAIRNAGSFDLWLDFGSWPRINALLSYFSRSALRVGFRTPGQYRHYLYDVPIPHSEQSHELENYRRLLQPLAIACNSFPKLEIPAKELVRDQIVIHMFPGGYRSYLKEWPEEKWGELISNLTAKGYKVVLTGTGKDREKALSIAKLVPQNDLLKVVAGETDMRQTAELLKTSRLVISVNTGIMHMAAALGCNLVALHGPTSQLRWGPLNTNSLSVQSPLPCSPCLNLGFDYRCREGACMAAISLAEVMAKINLQLASTESQIEPDNLL